MTIVLSFLHKNSVGVDKCSDLWINDTFFKEILFSGKVEKDVVSIGFEDSDVWKEPSDLVLDHFCWMKSLNDFYVNWFYKFYLSN